MHIRYLHLKGQIYEFLSKPFQHIKTYVYVMDDENSLKCMALHLFIIFNFPDIASNISLLCSISGVQVFGCSGARVPNTESVSICMQNEWIYIIVYAQSLTFQHLFVIIFETPIKLKCANFHNIRWIHFNNLENESNEYTHTHTP